MSLKIHYPKKAVENFLKDRFPETDWDAVINELPPSYGGIAGMIWPQTTACLIAEAIFRTLIPEAADLLPLCRLGDV